MVQEIPKKMKAVRVLKAVGKIDDTVNDCLAVEEMDVPTPKAGQVLIKVHYSTINPSDTAYIKNNYGIPLDPPCQAGFEGSGVVVASGGGIMGFRSVGKRVAFYTQGAWAEYAVADSGNFIELPESVPLEAASNALVNPMTVMGFIEIAKANGHTSLVHTAAASALGRILIRHGKSERVEVVCVVRRVEQEEICRKEGATHVVVTDHEGWENELKEIVTQLNTRLAFDAVAGKLTRKVLAAMPNESTLHVYGWLSGEAECGSTVHDLLIRGKVLKGFWLIQYLKTKNIFGMLMWGRKISQMIQTEFSSEFAKTVTLNEVPEGIVHYINNMTSGKVQIKIASDAPAEPAAESAEPTTETPAEPPKEVPVETPTEAPAEAQEAIEAKE